MRKWARAHTDQGKAPRTARNERAALAKHTGAKFAKQFLYVDVGELPVRRRRGNPLLPFIGVVAVSFRGSRTRGWCGGTRAGTSYPAMSSAGGILQQGSSFADRGRRNGWQRPYHPLQVGSWVIFVVFVVGFGAVLAPSLGTGAAAGVGTAYAVCRFHPAARVRALCIFHSAARPV